jgi:hypothetical protein
VIDRLSLMFTAGLSLSPDFGTCLLVGSGLPAADSFPGGEWEEVYACPEPESIVSVLAQRVDVMLEFPLPDAGKAVGQYGSHLL